MAAVTPHRGRTLCRHEIPEDPRGSQRTGSLMGGHSGSRARLLHCSCRRRSCSCSSGRLVTSSFIFSASQMFPSKCSSSGVNILYIRVVQEMSSSSVPHVTSAAKPLLSAAHAQRFRPDTHVSRFLLSHFHPVRIQRAFVAPGRSGWFTSTHSLTHPCSPGRSAGTGSQQ